MFKGKVKLKMIDDYVAVFRIIYFCKNCVFEESAEQNELHQKLKLVTENAIELKNMFETSFERQKMCDTSFLLLKNQLTNAGKNTSNCPKHKVSVSKLSEVSNKLKILECNHYAYLLKLK